MSFPFDDATEKLIADKSQQLRALLTDLGLPHVEIKYCTRLTWEDFKRAGFRLSEDGESVYTPVDTFASGNLNDQGVTLSVYI